LTSTVEDNACPKLPFVDNSQHRRQIQIFNPHPSCSMWRIIV